MLFLAIIVTLLAIGSSVLLGVLGYLLDRSAEPAEHKPEGNRA